MRMNSFSSQDTRYMQRALRLAKRGTGYVLPNPLVGAVAVKAGRIVGEGYHARFGGDHAEIGALLSAGAAAENCTLYVTLEPCVHFGKTPPCVDRIIEAGVRRVVVGMVDPNPLVAGRGIEKLESAGIIVQTGLLRAEAEAINRPFIKYMTKGVPFISVKIAQTLDGRIADTHGNAKWISCKASRKLVHKFRHEAGAVLVGIGTVLADAPQLTVRHLRGKQPIRIILDPGLRIPADAPVLTDAHAANTIVVAGERHCGSALADKIAARGAQMLWLPASGGKFDISLLLTKLGEMKIAHVFVEGGAAIFSAFLQAKAADHLKLFIAEKIFGAGVAGLEVQLGDAEKAVKFHNARWRKVGCDRLFEADFCWQETP